MSLVEVDTPSHNFMVFGICGTLLDLFPIQILLYLFIHLYIHLDLLAVHCIEVPGYTARGYTMAMHCCIAGAHYYTIAMHCYMVVVLG
jgi:hypothetical protein